MLAFAGKNKNRSLLMPFSVKPLTWIFATTARKGRALRPVSDPLSPSTPYCRGVQGVSVGSPLSPHDTDTRQSLGRLYT